MQQGEELGDCGLAALHADLTWQPQEVPGVGHTETVLGRI